MFFKRRISIVEDFQPLRHIEIAKGKPLRVKLDALRFYVCNLSTVKNLVIFFQNKDFILRTIDNLIEMKNKGQNVSVLIGSCYKMLIALLWQIGEKPWDPVRRYFYKRFIFKYFMANVEMLFDVMEKLMDYQTRLFFLQNKIRDYKMIQTDPYLKTESEHSWPGSGIPRPRFI